MIYKNTEWLRHNTIRNEYLSRRCRWLWATREAISAVTAEKSSLCSEICLW